MVTSKQTYQTHWVKAGAPAYYYDDYLFFETSNQQFQMLKDEFEFLFKQMHDNCWKAKKSKYIQIIKDWNELTGFADIDETPSIIEDIEDTIKAISLTQPSNKETFPGINQKDLEELKMFFQKNKKEKIKVYLD